MGDAPASLRARLVTASAGAGGSALARHEVLRDLAERQLRDACVGPPSRETAMRLLAADALITLACASVAESDPQTLGETVER